MPRALVYWQKAACGAFCGRIKARAFYPQFNCEVRRRDLVGPGALSIQKFWRSESPSRIGKSRGCQSKIARV
jgi:hypothetical protein